MSRYINAPRSTVYRAFLDARAVATWMVPTGMTSHVHAFDAREGGSFRISLTYDEPTATGKTTANTDTYHGRFVKLVTNEQVVEVVEFETTDPSLGTLFKRRATATAVQGLLRDGVQVVRCRVDRHDRIVKRSVPRIRLAWRRKKRGARA